MNSGNPTLDKNLECINKYNSDLAQAILELPCLRNDIQLVETIKNEPNLTYNGYPLHSQKGAEDEAKSIFQKHPSRKIDISVLYGIGLGHLFKEFCDNANNPIVLYEPNLEILRVTLELVDFSKELSLPNVQIASDRHGLRIAFDTFFKYGSIVNMEALDSYKNLFSQDIFEFIEVLKLVQTMNAFDRNLMADSGFDFLISVLRNLSSTLKATPLAEIKNIYKNQTAVIISAGPTLDRNIETLKRYRDKIIIFCVGSALKTLIKNNIEPDFLNIIELFDVSSQADGVDLSDINLVFSPYTNFHIQQLSAKQKFLFTSSGIIGSEYWAHLTEFDISEYIERGTVSYQSLSSAKILGCKRLVLVGQDLAYLDKSCYSKDSPYSDLVFSVNSETEKPEITVKDYKSYAKHFIGKDQKIEDVDYEKIVKERLIELNQKLCTVKGISGEMIYSLYDYASFIIPFVEFANRNKDLELINTSMLGAQIDGFDNVPLDKVLKDLPEISKVVISQEFNYDVCKVINNLEKEKKYFKEILEFFSGAKEFILKIDRDIQRSRIITSNCYKDFNALSEMYFKACERFYNPNIFYQAIMSKETNEIQYYINTTNETGDVRNLKSYALLKEYFKNSNKFLVIIEEINNQIELLSKKTLLHNK